MTDYFRKTRAEVRAHNPSEIDDGDGSALESGVRLMTTTSGLSGAEPAWLLQTRAPMLRADGQPGAKFGLAGARLERDDLLELQRVIGEALAEADAKYGEHVDERPMRRFRVSGTMTISCYVDVEARDVIEARETAADADNMQLCHSCSSTHEGQWSTSGELDGTPEILDVEELEEE